MDLTIAYNKGQSKEEAYESVKSAITPETIEKFKVKADIIYKDESKQIVASGKGFDLNIDFLDGKALVKLNLSLILRPLKSTILASIEKQVTRIV